MTNNKQQVKKYQTTRQSTKQITNNKEYDKKDKTNNRKQVRRDKTTRPSTKQ